MLHNSPAFSSPLRRRSIIAQKLPTSVLSENDDEAERIARRREISSTSTPLSSTTTSNKRHSLGLGILANIPAPQMAESINQCIKLSAENKINIKNAFSLEMIDFMTYMIKKQDDNMSNLQVASTSLDVSTKIYGFRVDSVYTKILKMVGGLDKQATDDTEQDPNEQEEALQEMAEGADLEMQKKKKKKKKNRQKILSTVESLRGNVEIAKPMSMMIGEGDLQTSDMLYQAMLPKHANCGFYQHLYNDVLVDVAEQTSNEGSQQNSAKYMIPGIEDFRDLEICASYFNFKFLGWSVDDEPEETLTASQDEHEENRNGFEFDLEASVEQDDNSAPEPINYFDIEHDDDEQAHGCYRQAVANRDENIVDVLVPAASSKISVTREYSFVLPKVSLHWAGPSHWKFRNFARPLAGAAAIASASAAGKVMGACMQAPLRKRKEIELTYDGNRDVIDAKFALSQSNKLQAKTARAEWSTESLILPEDVHYDIARMTKLYLHRNMSVMPQDSGGKDVADVSDGDKYDYNNPNDTYEYCPGVNNDNYDEGGKDNDDNEENECNVHFEDDGLASQGFTGDNLVAAPKLANKMTIAYCLKAKKIDMRQLKKSIWHCLKSKSNVDTTNIREVVEQAETSTMTEAKQFSDVYKMLPKLLTKSNAEALSVPLSFISLLHLANEKELKLYSLPDMSDVIVEPS